MRRVDGRGPPPSLETLADGDSDRLTASPPTPATLSKHTAIYCVWIYGSMRRRQSAPKTAERPPPEPFSRYTRPCESQVRPASRLSDRESRIRHPCSAPEPGLTSPAISARPEVA